MANGLYVTPEVSFMRMELHRRLLVDLAALTVAGGGLSLSRTRTYCGSIYIRTLYSAYAFAK
jgi:hypothetical protein